MIDLRTRTHTAYTHAYTRIHTRTHAHTGPLSSLLRTCITQRAGGVLSDEARIEFGEYFQLSLEAEQMLDYNPNNHSRVGGVLKVPTLVVSEYIFSCTDLERAAKTTDEEEGARFECRCGCGYTFSFCMIDADDLILRCFKSVDGEFVMALHGRARSMDGFESFSVGADFFVDQIVLSLTNDKQTEAQLKSALRFVKRRSQDWGPEFWQRVQVAYGLLCCSSGSSFLSLDFFSSSAFIGDRREFQARLLCPLEGGCGCESKDLLLDLVRREIVHPATLRRETLRELAIFGTDAKQLYKKEEELRRKTWADFLERDGYTHTHTHTHIHTHTHTQTGDFYTTNLLKPALAVAEEKGFVASWPSASILLKLGDDAYGIPLHPVKAKRMRSVMFGEQQARYNKWTCECGKEFSREGDWSQACRSTPAAKAARRESQLKWLHHVNFETCIINNSSKPASSRGARGRGRRRGRPAGRSRGRGKPA